MSATGNGAIHPLAPVVLTGRGNRKEEQMRTLMKDLRYGLRMLVKSPGFTIVAVLSLALGIGANTTVFSLLDAIMLRSLPVQHPHTVIQRS